MVLITGGSGVLGREILRRILKSGSRVRIYDIAPPPDLSEAGLEFIEGDIRDREGVIGACRGCNKAIHLAARMPQWRLGEKGFGEINVGGTINLLDGCIKYGLKRVVFASTIEIYGVQRDMPVKEDAPLHFTGIYSRNKWECEKILLEYKNEHGLEVVSLRMPMITGPGFYHEKMLTTFFKMARYNLPIPLPVPSNIPFSLVHSSDAADAFILALRSKKADGEAFNVAAPDSPPIKELLKDFSKEVGSSSRVISLPSSLIRPWIKFQVLLDLPLPFVRTPAELLEFAFYGGSYDISKARRFLNYSPKKSCLDAMAETYRWYIKEFKVQGSKPAPLIDSEPAPEPIRGASSDRLRSSRFKDK